MGREDRGVFNPIFHNKYRDSYQRARDPFTPKNIFCSPPGMFLSTSLYLIGLNLKQSLLLKSTARDITLVYAQDAMVKTDRGS